MSVGEYLADSAAHDSMGVEPVEASAPARPRQWFHHHHHHRRQWRVFSDDVEAEVPPGAVPLAAAFVAVRPPHPLARPTDPGVEVSLQVLVLRGALRSWL